MGSSSKKKNLYTIGFYNLENLFDIKDDPHTLDDDFTPDSDKKWNEKRYNKKVKKLGRVISQIGYEHTGYAPAILGIAEVENNTVIEALLASKFLKKKGYNYVHYDSPDERGIDTALLYRKDIFKVDHSEVFGLQLTDEHGAPDHTRDVLHVRGRLEGEAFHILVNHWPSRRSGTEETEHKRIAAAEKNREIIAQIISEDPDARIVIMGDFNDNPKCKSIYTLMEQEFYNPMDLLWTRYEGSLNHRGAWNLFDQIILSNNFLKPYDNPFQFEKARIFNPKDLQEFKGRFKGNPFRTYAGPKYKGGISDHFPVYTIFSIGK